MSGASEVYDLARDFGKASAGVAVALYAVYKESGDAYAKDWQASARATAGKAAPQYADKITSETRVAFGIEVETGPVHEGQGELAPILEFGSPTSPAHLDGLHAMPAAEKRLTTAADAAIARLVP